MKNLFICLSIFLFLPFLVFAENIIIPGNFSMEKIENEIPKNFKPLTFQKIQNHTRYLLVEKDNHVVVKAEANASASGLIRKMQIDLKKYPVIEWSWLVENIYEKGNVFKKSGDDYPARIYIAFEYDSSQVGFLEKVKFNTIKAFHGEYPPIGAINYIFGSNAKKGAIVANPYTDRVKMIVVDSGNDSTGKWISYSRNLYDDYVMAFGKNPPLVSGIAIMTDSDNTKESAVAYYGDIIFKKNMD